MYKKLLDTDIFSEVIKEVDETLARKARAYRTEIGYYTISAITAMEYLRGITQTKTL